MDVICVENFVKNYGKFTAVENLSFTVQQGEIFGIVGTNGAGKTTTVECLAGLRKPSSGKITVLGLDPQKDERILRRRLGIQLQQSALPEDLKVWEALDLFASFYDTHADLQQLMQTWGLEEKRNARFSTLSGGQKQRLFIALALINDPEVVVLDELTTGLDPQARHDTWKLVEQLRDNGKTVILVTHFMDEAERLCDRVAILDQGRLVALDSPKNLIHNLNPDLRVCFSDPLHQNWDELRQAAGVHQVETRNGDVIVSGNGAVLLSVATIFNQKNFVPMDLYTERTTLEDVFLKLTGRKIGEK